MKKCVFCKKERDEIKYGKFIKQGGLSLHYFCMLFASNLAQRDEKCKQGILGFHIADIRKELRRGRRLRCSFCKLTGATIGCSLRTCRIQFHMPCGIKNHALHQFFGTYKAFCSIHRPEQQALSGDNDSRTECPICKETVKSQVTNRTIRTPCCKRFIHRECIQNQAVNAGYYFLKCPLCNNDKDYYNEIVEYGIYVPKQDATWELEPRAYEDLLHTPNTCEQVNCHCPNGRKYNSEDSLWRITLCNYCGAHGSHTTCGDLDPVKPSYECDLCKSILSMHEKKQSPDSTKTASERTKKKKGKKKKNGSGESKSDEDVRQDFSERIRHYSSLKKGAGLTCKSTSPRQQFPSIWSPDIEAKRIYNTEVEDDIDVITVGDNDSSSNDSSNCDEIDVETVDSIVSRLSPNDFPSPKTSILLSSDDESDM